MVIRLLHFSRAGEKVKGTLLPDNFSKCYCVFAFAITERSGWQHVEQEFLFHMLLAEP